MKWLFVALLAASSLGATLPSPDTSAPRDDPAESQRAFWDAEVDLGCVPSDGQLTEGTGATSDTARVNCFSPGGGESGTSSAPCTPLRCPPKCLCTETVVNCSGAGLWRIPASEDCPQKSAIMDLSHNHLTLLRPQDLMGFQNLKVLLLNQNQIQIIEETQVTSMPLVQTLDLSNNGLLCSCSLRSFLSLLATGGNLVADRETELCASGSVATVLPCAEQYISCILGPPSSVLRYTIVASAPLPPDSCHALCFRYGHSHYVQDEAQRCLCGSITQRISESCRGVCSSTVSEQVCNRRVLPAPRTAEVTVSLLVPAHCSLFHLVEFSAQSSVPITHFVWSFRDGGPPVSTTAGMITHRFSLPGKYKVRVQAEGHGVGAQGIVTVSMPVQGVELKCPSVTETGHIVQVMLQAQQGTGLRAVYGVLQPDGHQRTDDWSCPRGGRVFPGSLRCYWLSQLKDSCVDARSRCRSVPGGDLADITTKEVLIFLQEVFQSNAPVWVNMSQSLRGVDGGSLDLPPGQLQDTVWACARLPLVHGADFQRGPYIQRAPAICESSAGASLPDVSVYMLGVPLFSGSDTENIPLTLPLVDPQRDVEVMVFPGLWFSHSGSPLALEFGVQPLQHEIQVRVQILRPFCSPEQYLVPPGCDLFRSPYAMCHSQSLCNTTGGCPMGKQWCPLSESCLNVTQPCSTYAFQRPPYPPRYLGMPPSYSSVADISFQLSPNARSRTMQVMLSPLSISVHPDDILSIQHSGERGSLLQCAPNPGSPWCQSYVSMMHQGWWKGIVNVMSHSWVDNVVCDLRVIFVSEINSLVVSSLLSGFKDPGTYKVSAIVHNAVSMTVATCDIRVLSPISDLKLVHPSPWTTPLHVATQNPTLFVISALSSSPASVQWSAPVQNMQPSLHQECPQSLASTLPACSQPSNRTGFSWTWLNLDKPQIVVIKVVVTNEISVQNLSLQVQSHDPIQGLSIQPDGQRHVRLHQKQIFTAVLSAGSSAVFTWTIDNMDTFLYRGPSCSVTFRTPGSYRLRVRAENPVSAQELEVLLTVGGILPLQGAELLLPSNVLLVNESQKIDFQSQVDSSSEVTIRWDFGDDSPVLDRTLSPPYDPHLPCDSEQSLVTFLTTESHRYNHEGYYQITVMASNNASQITCSKKLQIVQPLTSLTVKITPQLPLQEDLTLFHGLCLPSSFAVTFSWDFGDGSGVVETRETIVKHVYLASDSYSVTVTAHNGKSHVNRTLLVVVAQMIEGLELVSNGTGEIGTDIVIIGSLQRGTDVMWNFYMGDGEFYLDQTSGFVRHIYTQEGHFNVTVMARNSVSSAKGSLIVDVYRINVTNIFHPSVISSLVPAQLTASLSIPVTSFSFLWEFGDASPPALVQGEADVWHTYLSAGNYTLQVMVRGAMGSDTMKCQITVEDVIISVTLKASPEAANLSQPILFSTAVLPSPDAYHRYWYQWDFGDGAVNGPSSGEASWAYKSEGVYRVAVKVWNGVSQEHAQCHVTVQKAINDVYIHLRTGIVVPQNVKQVFTATVSKGVTAEFIWDFGDMSPSCSGHTVSHIFQVSGDVTVRVQAQNNVSYSQESIVLSVLAPVTGLFLTADQTLLELMQLVCFWTSVASGDSLKYKWSECELCPYKEGSSNLSLAFSKPGIVTVSVWAENAVSSEQTSISVEVQEQIQGVTILQEHPAVKGYAPLGELLTFTALTEKGSNLTYQWVLWPGQQECQGPSITVTPSVLGELQAEVKVQNSLGSKSAYAQIQVIEKVKGVILEKDNFYVALGTPVEINASILSGTEVQYSWDLGEGVAWQISQSPSLIFTYPTPGLKVIKLTVYNILSSGNASTELSVQDPVSKVNIRIKETDSMEAVISCTRISLHGSVQSGTDLVWKWTLPKKDNIVQYNGQNVSHIFMESGQYQVWLHVWNNVSSANASTMVNVQDTVTGLVVSTDRNSVCIGQEVTVSLRVLSGTNVSFVLTVPSLNLSMNLTGAQESLSFTSLGQYEVVALAYNHVSRESTNFSIKVQDNVKGLKLLGLQSTWPVNQTLNFSATMESQQVASLFWTFQELDMPEFRVTGHSVSYTPLREGTLHVLLNVSNHVCFSSVSSLVNIQSPVTSVMLSSSSLEVFLNQTIQFFVVTQGGSDLRFLWSFGDSERNITSTGHSIVHRYSYTGLFVVHVFVYNLVSWVQAQTMVNVRALKCEQPRVQMLGGPSVVFISIAALFEVTVDLKGCTQYRATYQWDVHRGSTCHSGKANLPWLDITKPILTVPGYTLDIGLYCLLFTVTLQGTALSHNITHTLLVTLSPLVAVIRGGSNRTWPLDMDLILDGRESYDPNLKEVENSTLEYEWSSDPVEGEGSRCLLPALPSLPMVSVIPSSLCDQSTVIFTLTIHKPGQEPATARQTVSLHSGAILVVSLRCVSCRALSSSRISHSVEVILSGECDACHRDTQYTWMAQDTSGQPLPLDNFTTSTGLGKRDLVIRRGALQDGLSYTFTLRVTQRGAPGWGQSSITLAPNNPPAGGLCSLLPQSNIFWLETPLEYNCTGWLDPDEDGQLLFLLSVQICSAVDCQRLYLYRGTRSWHRVRSPVGKDARGIRVFVEIEDMHGARTMAINRTLLVSIRHTSSGVPVSRLLRSHGEVGLQMEVGDTQQVLPYSLEIITALNLDMNSTEVEKHHRVNVRSNITSSLASLPLSSLWDVTAVSAALTQCVVVPQEVASGTWIQILETAEKMIRVLGMESHKGYRAEKEILQNILTLLGGALAAEPSDDLSLQAFNLTRYLMTSFMKSHMPSEEPLSLDVPGVRVQGARVLPEHLLCSTLTEPCKVYLPPLLPSVLGGPQELLQLVTEMDSNPFSHGFLPSVPVTSQLVALEFRSPEGDTMAVTDLPPEAEIQLRLPVMQQVYLKPTIVTIQPGESVNFRVTANVAPSSAGVHLHVTVTLPEGLDWALEGSPGLLFSWRCVICNQSDTHRSHTFSLSPSVGNTQEFSLMLPIWSLSLLDYQVNVTNLLSVHSVKTSLSLFSTLCQYFHMPSRTWKSEGVTVNNASQPHQIVCHTRHLTVFGASLFVPPHQLVLLPPVASTGQRTLVVMTCFLLLTLYLLLVLISHKLDHLDVSRVGTIPLCGQPGRYQYWVLLKTGWRRGAGSTAHVGISLYGLVKSGARYLDSGGALSRGGVDIFQVETESNLGEIWKIRVWHDNTGLDPSWFLQHVAILDKQTDFLYFFLVNDWLSVENERNGGRVEKEVLAACPQELQSFSRVFPAQMLLGFTDWHLWLSVWWRPARSRFTRVQRLTCCMLTLFLYITVCALWYGAVGIKGESSPLGARLVVTWQSVSVGVLVSVLVLPLQLLFIFLFRETHSKVNLEDTTSASDIPDTEQDKCVNASSLLSIPGGGDSLMDITSHSYVSSTSDRLTLNFRDCMHWQAECSLPPWLSSCDSIDDVPYVWSSESALDFTCTLRRKKAHLHLGFQSVCSSGDDPLSLSGTSSCSRHLSLSEENLLCSIAAETQLSEESDSGRFSRRTDLHSHSPWSDGGYWPETRRWSLSSSCVSEGTSNDSELQHCCDVPSVPPSPFTTRIGVRWSPPGWLFPSWMLWVVYPVLFILVTVCVVVTVLYGSSLSNHGFLLWLISSVCALLTSAFLLEPLKVVLISLWSALYRPPVLSEGEGLVEEPLVKKMSNRQITVRAPGGFSLLQAKEEARRVRALRSLIKSCAGHMVFFLLVVLVNYQSCFHDNNIRLLHTAIKRSVTRETKAGQNFTTIQSVADLHDWLDLVLPTHLYSDPRLTLLGVPRLCQYSAVPTGRTTLSALQSIAKYSQTSSPSPGWEDTEPGTNPSPTSLAHNYADHQLNSCLDLGNSTEETQRISQELKANNWIARSVLELEITQHHRDVQLHVATILNFDLTPAGAGAPALLVLPFHLLELRNDLDLPLALALSLLFAALCFLVPELVSISSIGSSRAPCWTHVLLGVLSGTAGSLHMVRTWLTRLKMDHHRLQPWSFTSLHAIALLSRAEVALIATLLLLNMLQAARQLRFVRRWAVFGKTFQAVAGDMLGCGFLLTLFLIALTHSVCLVGYGRSMLLIPYITVLFNTFHGGLNVRTVLQELPLVGVCIIIKACLVMVSRGFMFASVLSGHRNVHAENYRPALEPQDHEMIDFLVKRFKLWLGLSKAKQYRHTVRFEGFQPVHTSSSSNSLPHYHLQPVTILPPSPGSPFPEDLPPPDSPHTTQSSSLAVARLPLAVSELLDRLERVTMVLTEVSELESKLELWHKTQISCKPAHSKGPSTSNQRPLPRTYSAVSESALTCLKTNMVAQNTVPESADLMRRARMLGVIVSAGVCQRTRLIAEAIRRPHSEERSGGNKRRQTPLRPITQKRRAWDPEKTGDTHEKMDGDIG